MDLFGIGPLEILLILFIALIIFGPGRLPEIGRVMGRAMHTLKKATSDLTLQVTKEVEGKDSDHTSAQAQKGVAQTGEKAEPHR